MHGITFSLTMKFYYANYLAAVCQLPRDFHSEND